MKSDRRPILIGAALTAGGIEAAGAVTYTAGFSFEIGMHLAVAIVILYTLLIAGHPSQ